MYILYIVACQRGGVSEEPLWLRATRHGPGTLWYVNRWTRPDHLKLKKKYRQTLDLFYQGIGLPQGSKIRWLICYNRARLCMSFIIRYQSTVKSLIEEPLQQKSPPLSKYRQTLDLFYQGIGLPQGSKIRWLICYNRARLCMSFIIRYQSTVKSLIEEPLQQKSPPLSKA